ncbi:hypothetical protein CC80DRAFT_549280 [Byssothecium circinans]|uniref:Phosphodiester glycosidase domain-containing protein n=1 Tax=Byssothecium circinans TaxID=147558 RepID=A0A6A5TY22_9PLEO|nr:hypothetical protein CC80DRAFT_549280 [Byssothecium circinans]
MRLASILALAAVLSLGASGVLSSVTCENRGVDSAGTSFSSAGFLVEEVKLCIEELCATKWDEGLTKKHCVPVVLTVTHLQGPSSGVEDCVSQFSGLIDQCIITKDAQNGSSQTKDAFEARKEASDNKVFLTSRSGDLRKACSNDLRKPYFKGLRKPYFKGLRKPYFKGLRKPYSKDSFAAHFKDYFRFPLITSVKSSSTTGKSSSGTSKITSSASVTGNPTSKPSSSANPSGSACPLPPKKGKNGKGVQRRCEGDEFYQKKDLLAGKVTHWKFNTMGDVNNYQGNTAAKQVLGLMNNRGQLDVVKVSNGDLLVTGNAQGGSKPPAFGKKGGNYLLFNGGFFQNKVPEAGYLNPVGETRIKPPTGPAVDLESHPVPKEYAAYYQKISGAEGTFVRSGPDLKQNIPEISSKSGVFKYPHEPVVAGALDHASQPNERLALVTFSATQYLFAYTCEEPVQGRRECGISTNRLKELIDGFFARMEAGKSLKDATQAVNLDGGPSIYMSWNTGTTEQKIAMGGKGDMTPDPNATGRDVVTMMKITPR